jgi:hypothetical protein
MSVQENASQKSIFDSLFNKENSDFWERTKTSFAKVPLDKLTIKNDFVKKTIELLPNGAWIAGGAARSCFVSTAEFGDIDIYFSSKESLIQTYHNILQNNLHVDESLSKYSITLKGGSLRAPLSLIKIAFFDDPYHCLDSFDFTVCQFAVDRDSAYFNVSGLEDVKTRKLYVHKFYKNQNPLQRINKYVRKGYELTKQAVQETNKFFYPPPAPTPAPTGAGAAINHSIATTLTYSGSTISVPTQQTFLRPPSFTDYRVIYDINWAPVTVAVTGGTDPSYGTE